MKGWNLKRAPLAYLSAMRAGEEVGCAVWSERRWFCQAGPASAMIRRKRAAIRWLLAYCPEGTGVNEMTHQWRRSSDREGIHA